MSCSAPESVQSDRDTGFGPTGTIVLSTSCRLLFIDRNALDLLGLLVQDVPARTGTQILPDCILTVAREIVVVHSTGGAVSHIPSAHVNRLLGPSSQPIRVQGFTVPSLEGQDNKIVLVLSHRDQDARM
jgi:hypothetical protein